MGAMVLGSAATAAIASPVADLSRNDVIFGRTPQNIASPAQPVWITNTGDAPLSVAAITIGGANPTDFTVSGTCGPPVTLQSGERCRIDSVMLATGKNPQVRSATLSLATNAVPAPAVVALSGSVDNGNPSDPFTSLPIDPSPDWIDFPGQALLSTSAPQKITLANTGNLLFTLDYIGLKGGDAGDFSLASSCAAGSFVPPGTTCVATVTFTPLGEGPRSTELEVNMRYYTADGVTRYSITGVGAAPAVAVREPVVEYFNAGFGHYFMTADADEIAGLDAGAYNFAFLRTGSGFNGWDAQAAGTVPVCRFFTTPGTFGTKSSHFYTADPVECNGLKANPDWVYEKIAFFIAVPTAGVCPAGAIPIYRMYNGGQTGAPNHRFTTELSIYQDFTTTKGWDPEGIRFCSPQ